LLKNIIFVVQKTFIHKKLLREPNIMIEEEFDQDLIKFFFFPQDY